MPALVQAILWQRQPSPSLRLLDQRLLPGKTEYVEVEGAEGAWHAIRDMVVRGAPALAVAAALSLAREACDESRGFESASRAADYFVERASYLETR
jgi:methylthioribose-1-phosphate isomerase